MADHTPGPWRTGRIAPVVYRKALCWEVRTTRGRAVANAPLLHEDARLIAAAPDLLEDAEVLLNAWRDYITTGSDVDYAAFEDAIPALKAAIAKAKGEA